MSTDSAAVPWTQLELDEGDSGSGQMQSQPNDGYSPDPRATCSYGEDSAGDPYAASSTPSCLDLMFSGGSQQQKAPTPQNNHTWSQYAGHLTKADDHTPIEAHFTGIHVGNRFQVLRSLGRGSFGHTYEALDTHDNDARVAIKLAKGVKLSGAGDPYRYTYDEFMQAEWEVYQRLMAAEGAPPATGFPIMIAAGIDTLCPALESSGDDDRPVYQISYLVMQLLGPTVWEAGNKMREYHERATQAAGSDSESDDLSSQETSNVHRLHASTSQRAPLPEWIITTGKGMLKALADVHARGCIHRDVKTENFCLNIDRSNDQVFLIDYGFSRSAYGYYNFATDYDQRCASFWGTPNYSSLASLKSYPQTPRDDLEALVYCMLEMEQPNLRLPWNTDLTTNAEAAAGWSMGQLKRMSEQKEKAWHDACKKGQVPDYLKRYFGYITKLTARDVPDYSYLMMCLDSGLTGDAPSRPPLVRRLADWPSPEDFGHDNNEYAQYATSQVAAAAAKLLSQHSMSYALEDAAGDQSVQVHHNSSKRKLAADAEEQYEQQHVAPCKRSKRLTSLDGSSLQAGSDSQADSERPSRNAADSAGSVDAGCPEGGSVQPISNRSGQQWLPAAGDTKQLRAAQLKHVWGLCGDSQPETEE